ncbi:MAG: nucleotidyltransferase [Nitrospira sp.]|nr:nucleotidyltransferase [Nitrospira sp.]MDE0487321.1 nucleotidyltransferase [Nitrospira sp.]
MTQINPLRPPLADPADILLADVAIRIQLSRTDYDKAVQRYQTINAWIERDESPLKGHVELFYPQGSMAIEATIASKLKTDEFDIDVVAQLDLPDNVSPWEPLDLLYEAIRGEPESRYYSKTKRRTRCVTVDYSDDMHLDVTPSLRMRGTPERQSLIFHHRAEAPKEPSYQLIANPYGFAEWFKDNTPLDYDFADIFEKHIEEYERMHILAEADSEPVPQQEPPFRKSKAVIVLQLLKRWRNVQYDTRSGRRPPSIMIAKLVADAANHTDRLSEELLFQAQHILSVFREHHDQGRLVHIINPVCTEDVLTDRWPESRQDQAQFINDLGDLVQKVERLVAGCDLAKMQEIMVSLFGEFPAKEAVQAFNERTGNEIGHGRSQYDSQKGGLIIPASMAGIAVASGAQATPKHTFYGTERRKW